MGMRHGVLLFALLHILKTLPDLFEGLEHINQAKKEMKQRSLPTVKLN
ncbi:MAG: hypothetical protein AB2565_15460 [Candidatus Thiodiazotropha endolucinida]|uniref:Uncharacterized protein n=2 Tax=Candidatus Thiodiazotropha TaxID=1913444 RepID=A0A7Z1AED0_9GAMM|nr:hypothetical protein [Candidatus Thiodiazotropha endolucinida]MBT3032855.1 hypothetical protein [Candidatus Thiodiazotropha sp. (ex Lucina pensylvanica)]MBT3041173.1 hypothetical protein [Candidatus Thiodiazotropha sp. (ex Codakia orbicularis)]MBV2125708.1 hypothetical protein [Candidatus Thiodiazotropha taylori]MBT3045241.1 hypothetical protein [Candidatus Thiodiazotropha sp. (ex Codakia orbicularis)]MBT3052442.1 hypothetical protein [Candidatus Thiodiazotropha sp. (ex Codakia orbicularis)